MEQSIAQRDTLASNNSRRNEREVKWVNPDIPVMEGLSHRILKSESLGHDVGYTIWTPAGYTQNTEKRYPVIYFLHGMGGNETSDAPAFSGIISKAIREGLFPPAICVFPNGGVSGYRDKVEKMIIHELITTIDRNYRTLAKGQSRALAGFSMGGSGSVYLSVMHPELFCAAASMGGGFRVNDPITLALENAIPVWKKNNYVFFFVNGDNDRPEAFKDLSTILTNNEIENKVVVLKDTGHDLGKYYRESSAQLLTLLKAHLITE
jgi:enterochelin esterase-like enzyme